MSPYDDDDRLAAARAACPGWDIHRVFAGYEAVPAGTPVLRSTDLDGLVDKIRQWPVKR
jgi:hypothetical protein